MSRPTVNVGAAAAEHAKTPTQKLVEDANRIVHVTDKRGRVIGIRRMSMSVRRRVLKAISSATADKERYLGIVMLAACVVSIDGANVDPFENGATEVVFDNLIDRLDDEGFEAVGTAIQENFMITGAVGKEELKNS